MVLAAGLERFYLTGGTALSAFFFHHRLSEDLDFFSEQPVGIEEVLAFIKSLPQVSEVQCVTTSIFLQSLDETTRRVADTLITRAKKPVDNGQDFSLKTPKNRVKSHHITSREMTQNQ